MSFLDRVERCNRRDLSQYLPLVVEDRRFGWLTSARAEVLLSHAEVFLPWKEGRGVTFAPALADSGARSAAIANLQQQLFDSGMFGKPRRELYAIKNAWNEPEMFRLDRGMVAGFGARAYGVHLNGFLRRQGKLFLWIGTRAMDSKVEPGKRDNMVAGGQPAGLTLMENLVKECGEEAALSPELSRRAVPVSAVSYAFDGPEGLKMDTLFCYDLEMPAEVIPQASEEITAFDLMPVEDALALVRETSDFKFNVGLVILDFAMRHGVLDPDRTPDYDTIARGLRECPQPVV